MTIWPVVETSIMETIYMSGATRADRFHWLLPSEWIFSPLFLFYHIETIPLTDNHDWVVSVTNSYNKFIPCMVSFPKIQSPLAHICLYRNNIVVLLQEAVAKSYTVLFHVSLVTFANFILPSRGHLIHHGS